MLTKTSGWSQFGIRHLLRFDLLQDKYLDKSDSYRKKHYFLDSIWCGNWGEEYHINKHGISPGRTDNPSSPHISIHHFTHSLFFFLSVSQQLIMIFRCWLPLARYIFLANMDKVSFWSQTLSWIMFQFIQNSAAWSFLNILHSTFFHIFLNLFKVSHTYQTTSSRIRPITIVL